MTELMTKISPRIAKRLHEKGGHFFYCFVPNPGNTPVIRVLPASQTSYYSPEFVFADLTRLTLFLKSSNINTFGMEFTPISQEFAEVVEFLLYQLGFDIE